MKSFLFRILIALSAFSGLFVQGVLAVDAPGKIHHFTIIAPATAKVGEAIDVTVQAKDKDDKIITGYRGSIFFQSDTDFGATMPAQGRAIQFKESDNGELKISKGVVFKRVGNQELTVTEALEDVGGSIRIRVEENSGTPTTPTSESITISTPEQGSTVTADTIMMSGKTRKNSKILIKLNGADVGNAVSNEDGIYTFKLTGINQQSNILSASVVDGSNAVIGTIEAQFNYSGKAPTYYNLSIAPALEVEASTGVVFLVDAEPGLSEVKVSIDGTILVAVEQTPGKYTISAVSPAKPGVYPVQVSLKNILGQTTDKPDAGALTVKAPVVVEPTPITPPPPPPTPTPPPSFKKVTLTTEQERINLNFFVDNAPETLTQFKIAYGENPNNLDKEVTTFTLDRIKKEDGSYNWYIPNLENKNYSFKIFGLMSGAMLIPDMASEVLSAQVGLAACMIGNIGTITVETLEEKTKLSWEALSGAVSYNVYRVTAAKDMEFVQNTTVPEYTIYIASGALVYEDFAVKALCDATTESEVPAIASKVQTGPGALGILIAISCILSILFIRRRYA